MIKPRPIPRVVFCGAVDDGKSTLMGRLLAESGSVPGDEVDSLTSTSSNPDYARLTDGLIAEKEQSITIDVAYRYLYLDGGVRLLLADSPGHEQYTRNMAVAASGADIAVVVVDLSRGVREQTVRHAMVCHVMGIRHFLFVLNKADKLASRTEVRERLSQVQQEMERRVPRLISEEEAEKSVSVYVPISALGGDNIFHDDDADDEVPHRMGSFVDQLKNVVSNLRLAQQAAPVRLPVQSVSTKPGERFVCGRLSGGPLTVGDDIVVWPSGARAAVATIRVGAHAKNQAVAGESVAVQFSTELDVARGDIISLASDAHVTRASKTHEADLVWLSDRELDVSRSYLLRCGPTVSPARITAIHHRVNLEGGPHDPAKTLRVNEIGRVEITCATPLLLDAFITSRETGGFILCERETGATVAAGMAIQPLLQKKELTEHPFAITRQRRENENGFRAGVIWLTGLSGSGKSSVADALQSQLFELGIPCFVLDGDSIRQTLSEDLGFSLDDRAENIRRVSAVAQLFVQAGMIAIVSLVSPLRADRDAARARSGAEDFIEVFVDTPMAVCEQRDTKGLYSRARSTPGNDLTGLGQSYEAPLNAEFHLDGTLAPEQNALTLREWVLSRRF